MFDRQPTLIGFLLELRPLRPDDWDALRAVASDPLIWEQHPDSDRHKESVFRQFFADALNSGGALVAIDRANRHVIGSSRYHGYDADRSEVEIGWSFLASLVRRIGDRAERWRRSAESLSGFGLTREDWSPSSTRSPEPALVN
jgi:RimJ/RimL family protein N-acetyltransferase